MNRPEKSPQFQELFRLYEPEKRPASGSLEKLAGGFSGASVFRYEAPAGRFVLRIWPESFHQAERITELGHFASSLNRSFPSRLAGPILHQGRLFHAFLDGHLVHVEPFLPGAPLDPESVTVSQIEACMIFLARCHTHCANYVPPEGVRWRLFPSHWGASPSLQRRYDLLRSDLRSGSNGLVTQGNDDEEQAMVAQLSACLRDWGPEALQLLQSARRTNLPLMPVFRDLWRDHFLCQKGKPSGIIDLNASGTDSPLTDITRFLGSLARNRNDLWQAGCLAYDGVRHLSDREWKSLKAFDLSNLLLSTVRCGERFLREKQPDRKRRLKQRLLEYLDRLSNY